MRERSLRAATWSATAVHVRGGDPLSRGTDGWRALARYKLCDVQTGVPTEAMCSLGTKPP